MSVLARWQQQLIDAITAPLPPDPLPEGWNAVGLDAYRGNARLVRVEALLAAFHLCGQIVGEPFMRGLCRQYVSAVPAASGNLSDDGAQMGDFIAGFAPAAELPYLADVARLDWARHQAAWADAAPVWQPAQLAALPADAWADVRLARHPAASCLQSRWPLAAIEALHQPDADPEQSVDLNAGGGALLVGRPQWLPVSHPLSAGEDTLLHALWQGQTLGQAADTTLSQVPTLALADALATLAQTGAFTEWTAS